MKEYPVETAPQMPDLCPESSVSRISRTWSVCQIEKPPFPKETPRNFEPEKREDRPRRLQSGWATANGGAKRIMRFFFGGGGQRTIERALKNHFWRPQKVGFVWSVPMSSKANDRAWTNGGGGKRIIGGGRFMVCFPLP